MTPYYADDHVTLYHGDCLDVLRTLPDCSVDSVVTDPPAGISFMGKGWDHDLGGRDRWVEWHQDRFAEMLRVLKPGGHALVWAMPRTSHWTGTALEQAGWEIRDQIVHMFGSGFPKSHDIGKAIDRAAGAEREVVGTRTLLGRAAQSTKEKGGTYTAGAPSSAGMSKDVDITAPATPEAQAWDGWGTALKPAMEIWWLARKPLTGTVAANVLAWGVGGINVDGCRVGTADGFGGGAKASGGFVNGYESGDGFTHSTKGRWPANVILDDTAAALLDQQSGESGGRVGMTQTEGPVTFKVGEPIPPKRFDPGTADYGGASRFFYTPKADRHERPRVDGISHPTVKPVDLMAYLVRLVTPRGGTVLDPFAGTGTTAEAATAEGCKTILIERESDYLPLIVQRLQRPVEVTLW